MSGLGTQCQLLGAFKGYKRYLKKKYLCLKFAFNTISGNCKSFSKSEETNYVEIYFRICQVLYHIIPYCIN